MKRRRFLQYAIVFLLLVVFPLVSWLYLKKGLNYRLDTLEALQPISDYVSDEFSDDSSIIVLVFQAYPSFDSTLLNSTQSLFRERDDVIFVYRDKTGLPLAYKEAWSDCFPGAIDEEAIQIFLLNQQGQIVNCYANDEYGIGQLTKHIAFLIPPEQRRTLQIRKEREK